MANGWRNRPKKDPDFQDLVNQDLKKKSFRPVYLLSGDDTLRIEGVVEKMRKDALGEAGVVFNFHVFQGDQTPLVRVLQQSRALPMLGGVQIVWVKNADRCVADAASQSALESYVENPVVQTILVLSTPKADKRRKWVKACLAKGYYFDFSPPTGQALVQWVVKAAARESLPLDTELATVLCELVGNDLLSLKSEIDKLALLAEDSGRAMTAEEIGRVIMDQAALEGYEITAQLEPGRQRDVLRTWFRLMEWGRSGYEIAPLLIARVRKAALLTACRDEGLSDAEIGKLSAQNPWSFRYLEPMARSMGKKGLSRSLNSALACDRGLKRSPMKPDIIIEKTIMELCREDKCP